MTRGNRFVEEYFQRGEADISVIRIRIVLSRGGRGGGVTNVTVRVTTVSGFGWQFVMQINFLIRSNTNRLRRDG